MAKIQEEFERRFEELEKAIVESKKNDVKGAQEGNT
jgi:hypothetical protein